VVCIVAIASATRGKIADLARDLGKELRQSRFDKTAESLPDYSFFEVFKNYMKYWGIGEITLQESLQIRWRSSFLQDKKMLPEEGY